MVSIRMMSHEDPPENQKVSGDASQFDPGCHDPKNEDHSVNQIQFWGIWLLIYGACWILLQWQNVEVPCKILQTWMTMAW